jgi:hypothetical protein
LIRSGTAPAGRTSRNPEGRAFRTTIGSFNARHPETSDEDMVKSACMEEGEKLK